MRAESAVNITEPELSAPCAACGFASKHRHKKCVKMKTQLSSIIAVENLLIPAQVTVVWVLAGIRDFSNQ